MDNERGELRWGYQAERVRIERWIVLTTGEAKTEAGSEYLDQYQVPYHLDRKCMVSCCRVPLD
jgi:hypothetical protein